VRAILNWSLGLLFTVACSADGDGGGGQCVPGASAMCWCDGLTPGVQECGPDNTFAPCVCDGGSGGGEPSDSTDGVGTTDGVATTDGGTNPTEETDGVDDTGDGSTTSAGSGGVPTECTDELFALWQACRVLASYENAIPCGPCSGGNQCENTQCSLECSEQENPGLDGALAACDATYAPCPDVIPEPIPNPYNECVSGCSSDFLACIAAESPFCDMAAVSACSAPYTACIGRC